MNPGIPNVIVTVTDNGTSASLSVPLQSVQLGIGFAIGGGSASAAPVVYATTQASSLQTTLIGGKLVEAGGLVCNGGGTFIAVTCPVATAGTCTAVQATVPNGSTSTLTLTLDSIYGAWDDGYWLVTCTATGTIGTGPGPSITISADAGRNVGATISLGTATSYGIGSTLNSRVVGGTGIQINFGAGTMNAGDTWRFSATGATWAAAGLAAAYSAYLRSPYSINGVGSTHIVGISASGSSSDIPNVQTALQGGVSSFVFPRAIVSLRDAFPPTAYGGSGETEATWMAALTTTTSGLTAEQRVCADGGFYNTPSVYPGVGGAIFSYRRSLAFSHAVRRTQIGLTTRAGRVRDGAYSTIVVNPATDPGDGFIYHDERVTPGLNAGRIGSAMTWPKQGLGLYQCQEPLLSPLTSQFSELVIGNFVDAASDIAYSTGVLWVSDNLVVQANGTLDPVAAANLQGEIQGALTLGLVATKLGSDARAVVSTTANVLATGNIPVTITGTPFGYVNSVTFTINLNTQGIA